MVENVGDDSRRIALRYMNSDATIQKLLYSIEEKTQQIKPKIAIILPTYCEAENIEKLIREIESLKLNALFVVIDDSSTDGTTEIVRQLQKEYDNIILFERYAKLGLGTAITDGFKLLLSLNHPPDYIITMDADYSHNPQDIPKLLKTAQKGYHLVVGSRYCKGAAIVGWHWIRWFISRIANLITSIMMAGIKMRDCTSGFRCYSRQYVQKVIHELHSETYEIQIETVKQAWEQGFKVKETPIIFVNRKKGKSKLTLGEIRGFLSYIIRSKSGLTKIPPDLYYEKIPLWRVTLEWERIKGANLMYARIKLLS